MRAPDEQRAEERAWEVVSRAYDASRAAAPARRSRLLRPLAATLAVAAAGAALISPPGMALLGEIRDAVGVERSAPALFRLPAAGRVLAVSPAGVWIVEEDGSRRLLGPYLDAAWSPHGRYVVATRRDELAALEPDGTVRWSLARRRPALPAWGGTRTDTRIAFLSGARLHVVGGDGRGDAVADGAAAVRPAWQPGPRLLVAYVDARGRVAAFDARGRRVAWRAAPLRSPASLSWSGDGRRLLALGAGELRVYGAGGRLLRRQRLAAPAGDAAFAPDGRRVALQLEDGRTSVDGRTAFAAGRRLDGVHWSPDGRWLLLPWSGADQWVFVRVADGRRLVAASNVREQLQGDAAVRGWCCAPG